MVLSYMTYMIVPCTYVDILVGVYCKLISDDFYALDKFMRIHLNRPLDELSKHVLAFYAL